MLEHPSNRRKLLNSETHDTVVRKKGNFSTFNEKDEIIRVHIYDGSQNPIVISKTYQVELFCNFDYLLYYPFDEEICSLDMTLKGTDKTFQKS